MQKEKIAEIAKNMTELMSALEDNDRGSGVVIPDQYKDRPMMKVFEVAELAGMSERNVRSIANQGRIKKVFGTGTKRCIGYTTSSVFSFLDGRN